MPTMTISLNGMTYPMTCGEGEEDRVTELATHLDDRLRQIARTGAAGNNESHLLVITAMLMMDDLLTAQQSLRQASNTEDQEKIIVQQAERIEELETQLQNAQEKIENQETQSSQDDAVVTDLIDKVNDLISQTER